MSERADVLRVQNDALLNEYHHLIRAQVRRIDEALSVLDVERGHLMAERDHLVKHLPTPEQEPMEVRRLKEVNKQDPVPKFIQKGPAT
jgi:Spy/CpxP family protein refolding chaperone